MFSCTHNSTRHAIFVNKLFDAFLQSQDIPVFYDKIKDCAKGDHFVGEFIIVCVELIREVTYETQLLLALLLNCHNRANSSLCFIVPKTSGFRPKKRFIEVCHSDLFPAQGKKRVSVVLSVSANCKTSDKNLGFF